MDHNSPFVRLVVSPATDFVNDVLTRTNGLNTMAALGLLPVVEGAQIYVTTPK